MLKWAVYGKKNQDARPTSDIETEERDPYTNGPYNNKTRRSLDAQTVKRSKKPSRYQRRSIGSASRKNARNVDKENINYIGNTPNYFKEGFVKKPDVLALKDVSNITPTSITPVKKLDRRKYFLNGSKDDIHLDLPPTPPTYSRRVREAKKRKLEMASTSPNNDIFRRDSCAYKSERRIKHDRSFTSPPKLSHSTSEPSLNELSDRLSATTSSTRSRHSIALAKNSNQICTTKPTGGDLVEIEYDENLVINCVEKPIPMKTAIAKSTLPIFGHHIFMENPLYFKKNEGMAFIRPLKRTRKKSNDFESSFKSPSVDKKDTHALVREACSPVSLTPLSTKLAALRFSTMSTHTRSQRVTCNDVSDFLTKGEIPFSVPLKDEETSTEMENKFILGKDSITNVTESTVSTTQMGDVTLERMIEDIIKSTKIVKSKRRILNNKDNEDFEEDQIPPLETVKDLFVNPQAENKANLIKEAKYVNLSRENSISPKNTPSKKLLPINRVNEKLLKNLPIGCFILEDGFNEREVRTPDRFVEVETKTNSDKRVYKPLNRSHSMKTSTEKGTLESFSSESTPDIFSAAREANLRLRRQKCIRRKRSTVSNESLFRQRPRSDASSILTLEMGIPSPSTALQNVSLGEIPGSPYQEFDRNDNNNLSTRSNVSSSSLAPQPHNQNRKSKELFGLTLANGIPSPITPVPNLKRSSNVLSEERAHKTSKLEEDLQTDGFTPVIEHKSSRRCLTYSPEECSINSSEEKRRSVASNKLEKSSDVFQTLKGTIDLEIITKNEIIDVHVIRCRDLQRPSGKTDDINAYAKVVISGVTEQSLPSQRSIFQRTSVLYGRREPEFQRHLRLPLPTAIYDHQMLHVSVWHRDKKYR
ncbi:hypothetical protein O0L34_g12740 [Tuta absoluta]|nr:hypothetical protein O0L34_g12740 [Tuta absoluta]